MKIGCKGPNQARGVLQRDPIELSHKRRLVGGIVLLAQRLGTLPDRLFQLVERQALVLAQRLTQQLAEQPDFGPKTSLDQGGLCRAGAHFGPDYPPVSSHRTGSAGRIGAPKEGEDAESEWCVAAEAAERTIDGGR